MFISTMFQGSLVSRVAGLSLSVACLGLVGCDKKTEPTAEVVEAQVAQPAAAAPAADGTELAFDQSSGKLEFVGAKITDSHPGRFETFSGKIRLNSENLEQSSVKLDIDIASMQIEPDKLKKHLLSEDFFTADKFPKATFESTSIKAGGAAGATHTITGNLTLRGTQKSITFPATISATDAGVAAKAEFAINRKDFGIVYPGMPDDLIKDDVVIRFDLNVKK